MLKREANLLPPYVSTRSSARLVTSLLLVTGAFAWIAVGFDFAELRLHSRVIDGGSILDGERMAYGITGTVVRWSQIFLFATTGCFFLAWLYRARVNVRAFGTRRLRFARHWTILGFLLPFANLVIPYRVVREVWQASDPNALNPLEWRAVEPDRVLVLWWGAFAAALSLWAIAAFADSNASFSPTRLVYARSFSILADIAAALAASFGYFVVVAISEAQDRKWARIEGEEARDEPWVDAASSEA